MVGEFEVGDEDVDPLLTLDPEEVDVGDSIVA